MPEWVEMVVSEAEASGGGMNMEDIFSQFGDIFGGGFGGFGGGGGGRQQVKGSNLRIRIKLNLEEMVNGTQKTIKVKKMKMAEGATSKHVPPVTVPVFS